MTTLAAQDKDPRKDKNQVIEFLLDNDEFAGINRRDRWYTNGYRLRKLTRRDNASASWEQLPAALCPGLNSTNGVAANHWGIGQNIYTQSIRNRTVPLANDRPIAALLYGTSSRSLSTANGYASAGLEVGVTGPAALGEQFQNTWHKLLGVTQIPAWQFPLRPRLSVVGHLECARSGAFGPLTVQAGYGISAGTTLLRARWAFALSVGPDRNAISLPTEARFNIAPVRRTRSWAAILGIRGNWTGYDYLVDGNTFGYQSDTTSRRFTGEWFAGISWVFYRNWRLQYIYARRSVDITGVGVASQDYESQAIGMVTISIPLQ